MLSAQHTLCVNLCALDDEQKTYGIRPIRQLNEFNGCQERKALICASLNKNRRKIYGGMQCKFKDLFSNCIPIYIRCMYVIKTK